MPAPEGPLPGDELLAAINDEMVALHYRYYHREPAAARTSILGDDLIACVMSGIYTDVEKTLIEIQQQTVVRDTRNTFQNTMQDRYINTVQDLSGRDVLAFISNHHVGPDIEIELFFLTPDVLDPEDPIS